MIANFIIVVVLTILSGTFAGLTLALFGLQLSTLERKMKLGDVYAQKVYPIRKNGNLLLCTLLLGNVISYTVMAIFLGSITSGVVAGFVATSLIFIFGEILPQAIFPRYALEIGAKLTWLVWPLLILFYPVAAPIAWLLDKIVGKEPPVLWEKEELEQIIIDHEDAGDGIIDKDEERIILGALSFSDLKVTDIMIPYKDVFYLAPQVKITETVLEKIKRKGFSRIPVIDTESHQVQGVLYSKKMIGLTINNWLTAGVLSDTDSLIFVKEDAKLDDVLNLMIEKKIHMVLVTNAVDEFRGVATMEDIMEEILKTELEEKNV